MSTLLKHALLLLALLTHNLSHAVTAAACPVGYTVAFFNGVGNTLAQAIVGANGLQTAQNFDTNPIYHSENVTHTVMYNHTGTLAAALGIGMFQDVAEVFQQRAQELDPSGHLGYSNLFMIWDSTSGQFNPAGTGYSNTVLTTIPGVSTYFEYIQNTLVSNTVTLLSRMLSNPPTEADYATHRAQLDTIVAKGHKILMVAHSQGNLFVNKAYDYVQPIVGTNSVKVVHVAPASPTLRGDWILSDKDLIINGLRLKEGPGSVPDNNLSMASSAVDSSGHTLLGTYLDRHRNAFVPTKALLDNGLTAMPLKKCPLTFTPANISHATAGTSYPISVRLASEPADFFANVTYKWRVSGNAGGLLRDPVTGAVAASFETASNNVTYVAANNALSSLVDTVTVSAELSHITRTNDKVAFALDTSSSVSFGGITTTSVPLSVSTSVVAYPRIAYYINNEPRYESAIFYVQTFATSPSVTRYEIFERGRTTATILTQTRVNAGAPVFDSYDNYLAGYGGSLVNMGNGQAAYVSIAVVSGNPPSADALALAAARAPEFAITVNAVTESQ